MSSHIMERLWIVVNAIKLSLRGDLLITWPLIGQVYFERRLIDYVATDRTGIL